MPLAVPFELRLRQPPDLLRPLPASRDRTQGAAQFLIVGDVVAAAAPSIKQPCPLANITLEQARSERKRLRTPDDRVPRLQHQGGSVAQRVQCKSSSISRAVALAEPTTPGMPAPGCVPEIGRAHV